jgi:hypothetical protein
VTDHWLVHFNVATGKVYSTTQHDTHAARYADSVKRRHQPGTHAVGDAFMAMDYTAAGEPEFTVIHPHNPHPVRKVDMVEVDPHAPKPKHKPYAQARHDEHAKRSVPMQ